MPPRRKAAPAPPSESEHSPDPLQMTGNGHDEQPTSARRSTRSRKVPDEGATADVGLLATGSVSGRKRAQPTTAEDGPLDFKERASKRAKVEKVVQGPVDSPARRTPKRGDSTATEFQLPPDIVVPSTGKRGRPRKTPVAAESPKPTTTTTPSKKATARRKPIAKEPEILPVKHTSIPESPSAKRRKSSAAPIRHSSNPLDDEHRPEPDRAGADVEAELGKLKDIDEPTASAGKSAFDLTSEQSREAFLRNERWQRDKDARNFNFEGDVNEGRKLRSGRGVVSSPVVDLEESDAGETEDDVTVAEGEEADDFLDEDERQKRGVSKGKDAEKHGEFEADNDYLSQLTYDTSMPVETQKSTLVDVSTVKAANQIHALPELPYALTPFARRVLRTVISNFAGCDTYAAPAPINAEEEKCEALMQLVNLLTGTVERGEGNSCLVLGAKGSGKTRTVNRAISVVRSAATQPTTNGHGSTAAIKEDRRPIIVRLDGLAQTNDMLAIREMGRQIALGQGEKPNEEDDDEDEDAVQAAENAAPTTLPAHLLAHLTAPSPRAIVVVIENFDLFTNHARQALLYCLLDVVQGVRTGPVASTGRGVAVIGVTSRMDTTLLLEKRVKSRFSQRIYRVVSPLSSSSSDAWKDIVRNALVPKSAVPEAATSKEDREWLALWESQVEAILQDPAVMKAMRRTCELTTDVRILLRPLIAPVQQFALRSADAPLEPAAIVASMSEQIHSTGWGKKLEKLRGLSHPSLVVLIIAKHFAYAGKEEFNLAMVEHEYQRFARTQLAGSGRARWSTGILEVAWNHLMQVGLLFPATRFRPSTNPYMQRFIMCRSLLSRNEIIAYFKGEGGKVLGTELTGWGRTAGGHA